MTRPAIPGLRIRDKAERAERLAYARAWRIRMKPHFDAIYGPEPSRCDACGQRIRSN